MRAIVKLAVVAVSLGGCSVSPDAGFSDVQRIASTRLGIQDVRWTRGTAEDKEASEAINRLLESPLTPESAVRIALFNNQRLQAHYEELGIAQAELLQAGLLENPTVSAEILFGGDFVTPSISIVQNVVNLVTLPARRTIATSAFERTKLEVAQQVLELAADVRSAFYALVADQQALELFRQVSSATEAAADLSQRQLRAGSASSRDQNLQQAQYAQAALETARIEARVASDRENLNRLLGLWGDQTAWNLPERLPEIPEAKPSIEGLELVAIERRLDLAGARQDIQTASMTLDLAQQLRFLPLLGLGVKFERTESRAWHKGPVVELGLPIFDQGQARIATLEAERRRSEKLFVALAVDVRAQVREAWVRLVAAQDTAALYRAQVLPLHERIMAENQRLASGMLISVYELLRSKQDQINAARDYLSTLKDYWTARADLERALAGPLPDGAAPAETRSPNPGS
jgi:cobalt-zinc-cadmium efflux system outer membrane protein